jgi:hypothetical protein
METSPLPVKGCKKPLPVKGCKIQAYARHSGPLCREGSLSCYTCCNTGPRFLRSHPKGCPIQSPLTTHEGVWRIYSYPDPHGGLVGWLVIYCFTSRSRIFHLYGDVTIAGEGLQNLSLCSALRAFEQGGIFIVPHLL